MVLEGNGQKNPDKSPSTQNLLGRGKEAFILRGVSPPTFIHELKSAPPISSLFKNLLNYSPFKNVFETCHALGFGSGHKPTSGSDFHKWCQKD